MSDRKGNALPLVGAALLPLLALVGAGIDMARSYLSETRLQQACDAGVLATRKQLESSTTNVITTIPKAATTTGNSFFRSNFRDGDYSAKSTAFAMTMNADREVSGKASAQVPTTIMHLFGKETIPINVTCTAQIGTQANNVDIMMVLDTTSSMEDSTASESISKIASLRKVVKAFHKQMEADKHAGTRIRYGFVPYSVNVNVGFLLKDEWVANRAIYQSREKKYLTSGSTITLTTYSNYTHLSGTMTDTAVSTYLAEYDAATTSYVCSGNLPQSNVTTSTSQLSSTSTPYAGPPSGSKVTRRKRQVLNGSAYRNERNGLSCTTFKTVYANYTEDYDQISVPSYDWRWRYAPIEFDVSKWRSQSNGCIEERATYEIDDYSNIDLTKALDLDIDLIPSASKPETQWIPSYEDYIFIRPSIAPIVTTAVYDQPKRRCPISARRLAEMTSNEVAAYVDSVVPLGKTYHDVGMIWGGRLLSPTGIFADDNADIDGRATERHLIFLTDGETETSDDYYTSYGLERFDKRRWDQTSPVGSLTLDQIVEKRFVAACREIKKRNITVWTISFGLNIAKPMRDCAGSDHAFMADNASELNEIFAKIAKSIGDLKLVK